MIPDWETREVWFSSLFPKRYPSIWAEISAALKNHRIPTHLLTGTKDVWVRDFLPVPVSAERLVKFRYKPDYLRGFPRLRTGHEIIERLPFRDRIVASSIILDGGNIVASSDRVIFTDKVFRENPKIEREKLVALLTDLFEGAELIVIPQEPEDPIGHADGVVRFLDEETVVVNDYSDVDPKYGRKLTGWLKKMGWRIESIPYSPVCETGSADLPSAVGNYVNFLRVAQVILLPIYGIPSDDRAIRLLGELLPGTEIVPLLCSELAGAGGVLNCASWCGSGPSHSW